MTYFQVAPGEVIQDLHMNAAIKQGIPPFANAAARDAAIPVPVEGQLSYLADVNIYQWYDGAAWQHLNGALQSAAIAPAAGWAAAASPNAPTAFRLGGLLILRGLINPTATTDISINPTIGTLPAGFRPSNTVIAPSIVYSSHTAITPVKVLITGGTGTINISATLSMAVSATAALGGIAVPL